MDSKVFGERLQQTRKRMGLTQKDLATATRLSQTAISRLENGEEVYASVLLAVLSYYHDKISLEYLLSQDFDIASDRLLQRNSEETRQHLASQIQRIANSLTLSTQSFIQQLEFLKGAV